MEKQNNRMADKMRIGFERSYTIKNADWITGVVYLCPLKEAAAGRYGGEGQAVCSQPASQSVARET